MNRLKKAMKILFFSVCFAGTIGFFLSTTFSHAAEDSRCSLKPEKGQCKAIYWKYFFDSESKKCKEFIWGGCDGVVPFETEADCKELCEEAVSKDK